MPIRNVQELREHLQAALELEHMTIPAYLCAMYSIQPDTNQEAYHVIRSVVIEEMLHLTLVANVLNSVGGSPKLALRSFVTRYPAYLPHSERDFQVGLLKFSPEAIDIFLKIERPTSPIDPPKSEGYHSIAQFYESIQEALKRLSQELGEDRLFSGDPAKQITPDLYKGGGKVVQVTDLNSALEALEVIMDQGEGLPHSIFDGDREFFGQDEEVAHFFRFQQIRLGRYYQKGDTVSSGPTGDLLQVDWSNVYNIWPNAKTIDYPEGSTARVKSGEFNRCYTNLLQQLEQAFNGQPMLLKAAGKLMGEMRAKATELMKLPFPGRDGYHASPTFEWVENG